MTEWEGTPWFDRLIGRFAPKWAAERAEARLYTAMEGHLHRVMGISAGGAYDAGKRGAPRTSWEDIGGSADSDSLPALPVIRARSRNLYNNEGNCTALVDSLVDSVVGEGITPEPRPDHERLGITPEQAKEVQKDMIHAWRCWAPFADVTGRLSIHELQEQWFRMGVLDGDVVIRPVKSGVPGAPFTLAMETIEADRVDTPQGKVGDRVIRGGVEQNKAGMPIAYWIHRQHPRDSFPGQRHRRGKRKMVRVPAWNNGRRNALHWFKQLRAGQSRGVPWLAPTLTDFKDYGEFKKAELFAAKVAACLTVILSRTDRRIKWPIERDADGRQNRKLSPGAILEKEKGQEVDVVDPKRPNKGFEPFAVAMLRSICAALGANYEIAFKDFSKSTWSSARASVVEARRFFRKLVQQFANRILQPIWLMLMEEAWRRGEIRHLKSWDAKLMSAKWHGPGWEWVDPAMEGKAQQMALEMGVQSKEGVLRSMGRGSFEDMVEQLAYEKQIEEEKGLKQEPPPTPPPGQPPDDSNAEEQPPPQPEQPDDDEEDDESEAA